MPVDPFFLEVPVKIYHDCSPQCFCVFEILMVWLQFIWSNLCFSGSGSCEYFSNKSAQKKKKKKKTLEYFTF